MNRVEDPEDFETRRLFEARKRGDAAAEARLLDRTRGLVEAFVRKRHGAEARGAGSIDDVVQDVLLRVVSSRLLDRFVPSARGAFGAYLRCVADGVVADGRRRRKSRGGVESPPDFDAFVAAIRAPDGDRASSTVAFEEALDRCRAIVGEDDWEAFHLPVVQDVPYADVATLLGITVDAARARCRRARLKIAARWGSP